MSYIPYHTATQWQAVVDEATAPDQLLIAIDILGAIENGGGGGTNIYNSDGTLTADRTLTQAGYDLTFEDTTRGISIICGDVTVPGVGAITAAALVYEDATDFFVTTFDNMLWLDKAGGIKSASVSVASTQANVGYQTTATQRNQFFANDLSSELEMGDDTYGTTVSLALMSLQNPSAGVYQAELLVRSSYTDDDDYSTTGIDLNQTNMALYILEPTVNGVVGNPQNKITLTATGTGFGVTAPSAVMHLKAGTATASTAPLKFTAGVNLGTAETGAMEYNGTNLFFTRTGTTRQTVLTANVVTTEALVSDTSVTVNIAGTNYKLLAVA